MAFGTKLANFSDLGSAERHAVDSAHYREGEPGVKFLFRVEAVSYSYIINADFEEYGSTAPVLELTAYRVQKWTPHGATLADTYSGARPKWVDLRPGAKEWASRTAREAVEQFAARRRRQLYILDRQASRARRELQLAECLHKAQVPPWL